MTDDAPTQYSLNEICTLVDVPVRTFRFYVQTGLVDRPVGSTKGARYGGQHLEQILFVKKWAAAGLALDRIRELLHTPGSPVPVQARRPGTLEVCSHLHVTDGLEMVIEPARAGMSPEQVRTFARGVMALYESITSIQPNTKGI